MAALIALRRDDAVGRDCRAMLGRTQFLRPNEQVDDGTACGALQRAARHLHPRRAERDRGDRAVDALEARAQHVDVADERRDETVDRAAIDLVRGAELADAASAITAIRSERLSASLWSCVTKMVVTPSLR